MGTLGQCGRSPSHFFGAKIYINRASNEIEMTKGLKIVSNCGPQLLIDCSFSMIVHARSFLHAMIDRRRREDLNQEEKGRAK